MQIHLNVLYLLFTLKSIRQEQQGNKKDITLN